MGGIELIRVFQESKEFQMKVYDYIEKIEIIGQSHYILLKFYQDE